MPEGVTTVIVWVCVAAFILCMIGALLALFEIWTPKSRATRKWLISGLLFSAVGAVGSFAAKQFNEAPASAQTATSQSEMRQERSDRRRARPRRPSAPATDPEPPPEAPDSESEGVREWAEVLGPRPGFETAMRAAYPSCVGSLGGQEEASVLSADTVACRRALNRFHTEWILPVYNRKAAYEENLEHQEETMRARHLEPDVMPRYSYVISEMNRLRGGQWDRFVALDRRIQDDIVNCLRRKCRNAA